jgi:beta-glucosidase
MKVGQTVILQEKPEPQMIEEDRPPCRRFGNIGNKGIPSMSGRRSRFCALVSQVAVTGMLVWGMTACAQGPATTTPVPREGAWLDLHRQYVDRARKGGVDLLFLGDSITQMWNNNEVWQRFYTPRHAANFGIGGDRTQHVLWRIEHGELDGIKPKVIVLMIGTNNLGSNMPDEIAQGVTAIVGELRRRLPASKILLLGIFPRGQKPSSVRALLSAVNDQIATLGDGDHVKYLDIGNIFLESDGTISQKVMPDYLHLTRLGYRRWADAMEPLLWSLLDEPDAGSSRTAK